MYPSLHCRVYVLGTLAYWCLVSYYSTHMFWNFSPHADLENMYLLTIFKCTHQERYSVHNAYCLVLDIIERYSCLLLIIRHFSVLYSNDNAWYNHCVKTVIVIVLWLWSFTSWTLLWTTWLILLGDLFYPLELWSVQILKSIRI